MTPVGRPPARRSLAALAALALALLPAGLAAQDRLVGHGGPVMDVAAEGGAIATAGFDNAVGLWPGEPGADGAPVWLEGHTAAVASVAFADGLIVSGGDDFALRLWDPETGEGRVLGRHQGKVADLAVRDGLAASAGWDGAVGLWPLEGGEGRMLAGHDGAVTAVAWTEAGLASASADGTVRLWDVEAGTEVLRLAEGGLGVTALASHGGWLAHGSSDGTTWALDLATGERIADLSLPGRPVLAMAVSPGGGLLALGDGEGRVVVFETDRWTVAHAFQGSAAGPIWALAWSGDRLVGAGVAPEVALWDPAGDPQALMAPPRPVPASNGERQFQRKCAVCHTLTDDRDRRAGPPLGDVVGRPAGAVPGYPYSEAVAGAELVWDHESIDALFEEGPDRYLPGTIMPVQRIADPADRRDLIDYLASQGGD